MGTQGRAQAEGQRPAQAVRAALERAIMAGEGQVYLSIYWRESDEDGARWRQAGARLSRVTWAAVWDALALDPEDMHEEGER